MDESVELAEQFKVNKVKAVLYLREVLKSIEKHKGSAPSVIKEILPGLDDAQQYKVMMIGYFMHKFNVAEFIEKSREDIAELEHKQWVAWAQKLLETEQISEERKERWKKFMVPYDELTDYDKDQDRAWADKVMDIIRVKTLNG